jgi:hypothetical protein
MTLPKIYADFQNLDDSNRLRLTCAGTAEDLQCHSLELQEGQVLTFYTDDANEQGQPDELRVEGVVHYDETEQCWVAAVDWSGIRHASEEETQDVRSADTSGQPPPEKAAESGEGDHC